MWKKMFMTVVFVLGLNVGSYADLVLLDGNYRIETLTSYYETTEGTRLESDSQGNVYINHYDSGKIYQMSPDGVVSCFADKLQGVLDMCWTGGSAYGEYLYAVVDVPGSYYDKIVRFNNLGQMTDFATAFTAFAPCLTLDRAGTYNNLMYFANGGADCYYQVSETGVVDVFGDWPGEPIDDSTAGGLDIDSSGRYGGFMYAGRTSFAPQDPIYGGIFKFASDGSVTSFSSAVGQAMHLEFAPVGAGFNEDMFVEGWDIEGQNRGVWRVNPDGTAEQFIRSTNIAGQFCFGSDGNMYLSNYDYTTNYVTLSRVSLIPEPTMLSLMIMGVYSLVRRRRPSRKFL